MIVLYRGRRGCGKTTTLVRDAYLFKRRGWIIVTNMGTLNFADKVLPNDEILELLDSELRDFVIVIDEIQTFIDSRRSMRGENVNFTYFIQQIRKRNVIILATTQYMRRVDLAFREHIDIVASPQYFPEFPVVVVDYLDLTAFEDDTTEDDGRVSVVYDPRPVYELFDTEEVITPLRRELKK